jgi:hypothetical protein
LELQGFCEARGWRFCFIGGIAVQRWSNPRFTHDADMTLLTGIGAEENFIDPLLAQFRERSPGEREFAFVQRVVRLSSSTGVPLDVALGALPFEERTIERASRWKARRGDAAIITCSADDLLVHKAFAGRGQDWVDLEGIVMRQGRKLNVDQIWTELRPLVELKEEPEILTKLQAIFDRHLD